MCAKDGSAFLLAEQNLSRAPSSEAGVLCAIRQRVDCGSRASLTALS